MDTSASYKEYLVKFLREVAARYAPVSFAVVTGDIHLQPFRKAIATAAAPFKIYEVLGNTDMGGSFPKWPIMDAEDRAAYDARKNKLREAVVAGDNLFCFMLSATQWWHEGRIDTAQLNWLDELLATHADKNVFVFLHHDTKWLSNKDALHAVLAAHRPKFRSMLVMSGHEHHRPLNLEMDGIRYLRTGTFKSGLYRVLRVSPNSIVTGELVSDAWREMSTKSEKLQSEGARLARSGNTKREQVAIPLKTQPSAQALPENERNRRQQAAKLTWRADDEPGEGNVLRLDFDEGPGRGGFGFTDHDRSGYGNDVADDSLFNAALRKKRTDKGWVKRDRGYAGVFGTARRASTAFDSWTLNSPSTRNRLTLAADVHIPEQPIGVPYGVVGKGAYELAVDAEGNASFRLWISENGRRRRLEIGSPGPLAAGQWHTLVGTHDGMKAVFYVNGKPVGDARAGNGARLCVSPRPMAIGFPLTTKRKNPLWIDNVRIANRVEAPGTKTK
jgi:hypothetical protein